VPTQRIVVGTDGSDGSLAALRVAADQARLHQAVLEVVVSWHPSAASTLPSFGVGSPAAETVDELHRALLETLAAEGLGPDCGITIEPRVVTGHAAEVLLDAADTADLVVVGSRGRGGFAGLVLGSVSQQVLAHAHCPVMVVPGHRS
jgi:nucleotide-binding universal stress UspA family protein